MSGTLEKLSHKHVVDEDELKMYAEQCMASLICLAAQSGEDSVEMTVCGVKVNSIPMGDWTITVSRVDNQTVN